MTDAPFIVHAGDMRRVLELLEPDTFDAIVTDPPYGLKFMGQGWDHGVPGAEFWAAALRVAKPGAHLVAFGGTRTYHRLVCGIEDAGWEIRDCIMWLYGSGFPKSLNVSRAIDTRTDWYALELLQSRIRDARTALGITQTEAARRIGKIGPDESLGGGGFMWFETGRRIPTRDEYVALKRELALGDACDGAYEHAERVVTGSRVFGDSSIWGSASGEQTKDASASGSPGEAWEGWGTALKPAWEPICLARKPFRGTIAENVMRYGTGALNIDACRIEAPDDRPATTGRGAIPARHHDGQPRAPGVVTQPDPAGRWPANLALDEDAAALLDAQSGNRPAGAGVRDDSPSASTNNVYNDYKRWKTSGSYGDDGGASRFFYTSKAGRTERNAGLEDFDEEPLEWSSGTQSPGTFQSEGTKRAAKNPHPTVKPLDLTQLAREAHHATRRRGARPVHGQRHDGPRRARRGVPVRGRGAVAEVRGDCARANHGVWAVVSRGALARTTRAHYCGRHAAGARDAGAVRWLTRGGVTWRTVRTGGIRCRKTRKRRGVRAGAGPRSIGLKRNARGTPRARCVCRSTRVCAAAKSRTA